MRNHARSEGNSTSRSQAPASALKAHVDLSLVAEAASSSRAHSKSTVAHSKSTVAHSKSTTDGQVLPNLSGAARARTLELARRLASGDSD
jgi:hypothetical protein